MLWLSENCFLNLGRNLASNLGTPPGHCCLVVTVLVVCIEDRVDWPKVACHIAGEGSRKPVHQKSLRFRALIMFMMSPGCHLFIGEGEAKTERQRGKDRRGNENRQRGKK